MVDCNFVLLSALPHSFYAATDLPMKTITCRLDCHSISSTLNQSTEGEKCNAYSHLRARLVREAERGLIAIELGVELKHASHFVGCIVYPDTDS